jgi:ribonucleoside-diphosphate reductase alpha chain
MTDLDGGRTEEAGVARPRQRRLPRRREAFTRSFVVGGAKGYLTASTYPDGSVGEIDLRMAKQGSTLAGLMDALSGAVTVGLQYGAPLEIYIRKLMNTRAEPSGPTNDPELPVASSAMDYVARRLAVDYLPEDTRHGLGIRTAYERRGAPEDVSAAGVVGWGMSANIDRDGNPQG